MEQQKTHWKSLVSNDYIGSYTLMGTGKPVDLTVKILSVGRQIVKGEGGKADECTVATLEGHKPFIINRTNAKTITKLYDSPYTEDWAGKRITLYVAKVKVAGDVVDALRIRSTVPPAPQLPELTPNHEKWNSAKQAIADGKTTIEAIRKAFTLTAANEALILAK
jgi:hypothetical protein